MLKPGGIYVFTVPHSRDLAQTLVRVAVKDPSDPTKDEFIMEKEYHEDGNSDDHRALCYRCYGLELDVMLQDLGFEVD